MRIRKNASKLLGFASVYANPWLAPPSPVIAAADCSEIVCELNCSPWDVMVMDPNSYCCTNLERAEEDGGILGNLTNSEVEEDGGILGNLTNSEVEEDGGILGNLFRTEEEEPICAITSNAAELSIKAFTAQISETKVEKIERKKKSKGKEKAAAEKIIAYCKKSDGKGWQCKRPAQLPHTLCSYHLAQIRSYSHRTPDASTAAAADSGKNHQTKEAAAAAASGLDSNLYYYYDGFGPLRGKRRGRDRYDIVNAEVKKEEKQDGSSRESDDDIVAGDDEYDLDCFDDYDDDNLSLHVQDDEEINGKKEGDDQEQKKMVEVKKKKKRGRKPIKARSLKSLL